MQGISSADSTPSMYLWERELVAELRGLWLSGSVLASQMDSMSVLTWELCSGCSAPSCPGAASFSAGLLSCSSMSSVANVRPSSGTSLLPCM